MPSTLTTLAMLLVFHLRTLMDPMRFVQTVNSILGIALLHQTYTLIMATVNVNVDIQGDTVLYLSLVMPVNTPAVMTVMSVLIVAIIRMVDTLMVGLITRIQGGQTMAMMLPLQTMFHEHSISIVAPQPALVVFRT
ncbi:hypothetical protein BDR05DRAFT_953135 [Suillus weaverae]|nr:hypothetical protein BDR05DRAFT_953135 [Suillus weaverae]